MTNEEAVRMLKAKLECMIRDVSGCDDDCNRKLCGECHLNYEQGNMGEQKEYLRMSIEALERESCENVVNREAVLDAISRIGLCKSSTNEVQAVKECLRAVEDLPSVTPQPKMGYWIGIDEKPHEYYKCDGCGYIISYTAKIEPHTEYNYCPQCGSYNGGGNNGNE